MIRAAQGNTLEFSCLGYDPARVTVGSKSKIDVTLQESTSTLDDVVIVGYGVQKKANLTGAVAAIRNEEIGRRPVMRATTALQGLASGVTVTQSTGQPGSMVLRSVSEVSERSITRSHWYLSMVWRERSTG